MKIIKIKKVNLKGIFVELKIINILIILVWQTNVIILTKFFIRSMNYYTIIWFKRPILAFKLSNDKFLIHLIKNDGEILSITIGINLWLAPQISEHWP